MLTTTRTSIARFKYSWQYEETNLPCYYFGNSTDTSLHKKKERKKKYFINIIT